MGEEVTSEAREYAHISAGTFQLECIINFVPGVTTVSQALSYFFSIYHKDGVLLHKMGVRVFISLRWT